MKQVTYPSLSLLRRNRLAQAISLVLAGMFGLRVLEAEAEDAVVSASPDNLSMPSQAGLDIDRQPSYLDIALQAVRSAPMAFGAPAPITVAINGGVGIAAAGDHSEAMVKLAAANSTGALAGAGVVIGFDQGSVISTAVASSTAAGQKGLVAKDGGSISANGVTISLTPKVVATGVAVKASNMIGVTAESGGSVVLDNTRIETAGGTGTGNHAVLAKGAGSRVELLGSEVSSHSTLSHGALVQDSASLVVKSSSIATHGASSSGVRAETGSHVSLRDSHISSDGSATSTGTTAVLHGLSGAGIEGERLVVEATGNYLSGVRADGAGSSVKLTASQIEVTGSGSVIDPSAAARAKDGGHLELSGVATSLSANGTYAHGLSVEGNGSSADVQDARIQVQGPRSIGINVVNGATAAVSHSEVLHSNSGTGAPAVLVDGAGSSLALGASSITSLTDNGIGLRASAGADVRVENSAITTSGKDAAGLHAAGADILANNVTIETHGDNNAMGAVADGNGHIVLNGGSVTTHGDSVRQGSFPHGLVARNPGGTLIANGTSVHTTGNTAYGAVTDDGGSMTLNDLSVVTEGDNSIGLYSVVEQSGPQFTASMKGNNISVETFGNRAAGAMVQQSFLDAPATLNLDGATIATHGDASVGLHAGTGGSLVGRNTSVVTEGDGSHGAAVKSAPSSLSLQQASILTGGVGAHGLLARDGGQLDVLDASIRASGQDSSALHAEGNAGALTEVSLGNSVLSNVSGATLNVDGVADLKLDQVIAGGSGQWLQVSALDEAVAVTPGLANIDLGKSLVSGSALTEVGSASHLNMHGTSLWQLTGSSNLTSLRNDASLIDFSAPLGGAFKRLTVNDYHGANGTIALNTRLYDDASPSDRLVIDGGKADGSSNLAIKNAGGAGALTTGNGIMVVDAINGGTTDKGSFRLLDQVKAGPYEYLLYRGSRDDSNDDAWYLRSTVEPEDPDDPDDPKQPIDPKDPDDTDKPVPPRKPTKPNYRSETSLYSAIPEMALRYSHALLDTLHERVGEERRLSTEPLPTEEVNEYGSSLGWGRVIYQTGEIDGRGDATSFDYDVNAFQVGLDLYRNEDVDGSIDIAGLSLGAGRLDGAVDHSDGRDAGDDQLRAYSVGGYWTHFGPEGWYVDGVLQFHTFDIEANSVDDEHLETDGRGVSASLEAGYPFEVDDDLFVEPQAQIVASHIELDDARDDAADVRFEDVDSLTTRLGLRIAKDWFDEDDEGDSHRTTAWIRPSIWHELKGQPQTELSSATGYVPFTTDMRGTTGEINLGIDHQVDDNTTITFSAGYQEGFDDDSSGYEGIIGVKIDF